jgi:hypothetical protein
MPCPMALICSPPTRKEAKEKHKTQKHISVTLGLFSTSHKLLTISFLKVSEYSQMKGVT